MLNKFTIETDVLGCLNCKQIVSFYDYPRVFFAESTDGIIYLMSEYKADSDSYSWLVCKSEEKSIFDLDKRKVYIQQLYDQSEELLIVKAKKGIKIATCVFIETIPSDCFVDFPLYLDGFIEESAEEEHAATVSEVSRDSGSVVVSFRAEKEKRNILAVSVERIKEIIDKFRKMFSSFGYSNKQSICFSKGSTLVNIIIEEDTSDVSDEESTAVRFADTFETMVGANDEEDFLTIPKISKTKIEAFRDLNTLLIDEDGDSEIIIAKPGKKPVSYVETKENVEKKRLIIDKAIKVITKRDEIEVLTLEGVLNGILTKDNKFEFTSSDGDSYKGTVGAEIDLERTFLINGKEYCVIIEKKKAPNGKVSYTLKSVDEPIHLV